MSIRVINMEKLSYALCILLFCQDIFVVARRYGALQDTDFFNHEGFGYSGSKVNIPGSLDSKTYEAQFPALVSTQKDQGTPVTPSSRISTTNNSGRRDYVNPNYPPVKPKTSTKPENVDSGHVHSGHVDSGHVHSAHVDSGHVDSGHVHSAHVDPGHAHSGHVDPGHVHSGHVDYAVQFPAFVDPKSRKQTKPTEIPSGGRDYVNPNYFPPLKPNNKNTNIAVQFASLEPLTTMKPLEPPPIKPLHGKIEGMSHFHSDNSKDKRAPTIPSYSSALQGPQSKNDIIPESTPLAKKNSTPAPNRRFGASINSPVKSTVLPSSILSNNKNNKDSGAITDADLQVISEELLKKDVNNAAKYVTVNYQEKTTSQSKDDKAPQPLLNIGAEVWNIPTVQKFVPLLDNYERDTLVNEYVTPQERNEENAFLDVIMSTSVIRHLMNVLKDNGYVSPDPAQQKAFLKQLWFGLYSRGKGKISSSGFEHIFVSELKNNEVSGLHNWIYFSKEESANRINYLGYLKYTQLNDKGAVLKLHFNQQGVDKPVDTMFIGTSPELEIALYTLCFVARADTDCNLKLADKDVNIVTHTFRYRSKNMIGSAYPQI